MHLLMNCLLILVVQKNIQMAHFKCCNVQECGKLLHYFSGSCSLLLTESLRVAIIHDMLVRPHHRGQLERISLKLSRE